MPITLAWIGGWRTSNGGGARRTARQRTGRRRQPSSERSTSCATGSSLAFCGLELVGCRSLEVPLEVADFFDLGWSPLFNSLPVIRDRLLQSGSARDYVMRWVDVPSLEVTASEQRYEPLGNGLIRFRSLSFTADIRFDENEFVIDYPGIARQAGTE